MLQCNDGAAVAEPAAEPVRASVDPVQTRSVAWFLSLAAALLISVAFAVAHPNQFTFWVAAGIGLLLFAPQKGNQRKTFVIFSYGLLLSMLVMPWANNLVVAFTPHTLDLEFSGLDGGASVAFSHWVNHHLTFRFILITTYDFLPFFICTSFLLSDRRSSLIRSLLLAGLLAPLCYLAWPAVGPAHIGDPSAPRNCMPSLHLSWTLLAVASIAPRLRWVGLPYVVLMATAVIGTGEHYAIDITAAVPYTLAILTAEKALVRHANRWSITGRIPAPEARPLARLSK